MSREDEGLFAEFHLQPVLQPEESHKLARPVYADELYIRIQIKGQKNQVVDRKARPEDQADFPKAWARWTAKDQKIVTTGTPITALPGVGPSLELELEALGIRTVEDLATLSDAGLANIRNGRLLQKRAQAYVVACEVVPDSPTKSAPIDAPVDPELLAKDPTVVPKGKRARLQ